MTRTTISEIIQEVPQVIFKLIFGGTIVGGAMFALYILLRLIFLETVPATWAFEPQSFRIYKTHNTLYTEFTRYSRKNQGLPWFAEIHKDHDSEHAKRELVCAGRGITLMEAGTRTIYMPLDRWINDTGCSDTLLGLTGEFYLEVYWIVTLGLSTKTAELRATVTIISQPLIGGTKWTPATYETIIR